jgi:hypothetical protein
MGGSILKIDATGFFETSIPTYETTRSHISENHYIQYWIGFKTGGRNSYKMFFDIRLYTNSMELIFPWEINSCSATEGFPNMLRN